MLSWKCLFNNNNPVSYCGAQITLYNVYSVHWGMFSTLGGVQYMGGYHEYIGGIPWVHWGDIMSTSGGCSVHQRDTMSTSGDVQYIGGYHEYIGGISWVHRGMFSTLGGYHDTCGGYHEYIGGCSVHQEDTMSTSGDIMSTSGDIMSTSGDVQYIRVFNGNWKDVIKLLPHMYHDIPPMYWTSPDVLMISPDVLMVSLQCTHGIPPMYSWYPPCSSWYPPDVLMIFPQCTEHPPMYWTPPDVLNIPRCTEHTLYRVQISENDLSFPEEKSQQIENLLMFCEF